MTVSVSSAAASSSVTVAVIVEEKEANQVDPEARAAHDQHQLRVVDFFRLEKFLKKKKRKNLKFSRYTGGKHLTERLKLSLKSEVCVVLGTQQSLSSSYKHVI